MLKYVIVRTSNTTKHQSILSAHKTLSEAEDSLTEAKASESLHLQPYWVDYAIKEIL